MSKEGMKTGMIGLGAMGSGMAFNLYRSGSLHRIWNRTPGKAESLSAETGVIVAASIETLVADCELILISVSQDADVIEVVEKIAATIRPGVVVVDTSTVSSETARRAAAILQEQQAGFLDAPVSGGVEGAASGKLAMMVGGEQHVLDRVYSTLEAIAARIIHIGPCGSGQACKAVNQIMVAGINQAVTDALAFGEAMGLAMEPVIDVIAGGAAGNWFLDHRGKSMLAGEFSTGFKLNLHHKDLLICRQMARDTTHLSLPIIEMTLQQYQQLMEQGYGDEDISALFMLKCHAGKKKV
jgi:3-hydroxyisobutyrate dehydrogenase